VTRMDPLTNALNTIMTNEDRHKKECIIAPASGIVGRVLRLIQSRGYIGEIEFIDDGRAGKFRVQLFGRINECRAVTPRYSVKVRDMERWEKRFLPGRNLGVLILTTPGGVFTHYDAEERNLGGRLLAYVY